MTKDNILNALDHTEEKKTRFFEAWKRGVSFVGPELFGPKTPRSARDKNELKPVRRAVEAWFEGASGGEKQLLGAMVSFYDPEWGEDLAARTDDEKSVCGLTFNLDHQEMEILCDLLRNYTGWDEG